MGDWFQKAIEQPWLFISCVLAFVLWKGAGKASTFIQTTLFGDEGIFTTFVRELKHDSEKMKGQIVDVAKTQAAGLAALQHVVAEGFQSNKTAIGSLEKQVVRLERQLVNAIQASPDDDELFKILFSDNPIPIVFIGPDYKFMRINKAAEDFWGYSLGELSSMTFEDVTKETDLAADLENVERVKAGTVDRYRMQKTYVTKGGNQIEAALYVFRYPASGPFLHFISIIIPIRS